MSQENIELVRSHYEAFARGDVEAALQMMDEQIEFRVAEHSVFDRGTPFMGRQEVAEHIFRRLGAEWDGFTVQPQALHDAGNVVVMQGRYGGTYQATGRPTNGASGSCLDDPQWKALPISAIRRYGRDAGRRRPACCVERHPVQEIGSMRQFVLGPEHSSSESDRASL
jgi:uncharacterized protein